MQGIRGTSGVDGQINYMTQMDFFNVCLFNYLAIHHIRYLLYHKCVYMYMLKDRINVHRCLVL